MAIAQHPHPLTLEICKIFGFDPGTTKSITIKIVPDDLIIVEAETIMFNQQADALITEMKKYEFRAHGKNEDKQESRSHPL